MPLLFLNSLYLMNISDSRVWRLLTWRNSLGTSVPVLPWGAALLVKVRSKAGVIVRRYNMLRCGSKNREQAILWLLKTAPWKNALHHSLH